MKKVIVFLVTCLLFLLLVINLLGLLTRNSEPEAREEVIVTETLEEPAAIEEDETVPVYRMLDFDRRLILEVGQQNDSMCSVYCLAYARAILDKDYDVNPYDYWDDGAVWRSADFKDIAGADSLDTVLQRAYDQIENGRPAIFYVSGLYAFTAEETPQERTAEEHFVLLIGHRKNADYEHLKPSDFYAADPTAGYTYSETIPWVILTDTAPEKMLGEYALFVEEDPDLSVAVCEAYADTAGWNSDKTKEIHPEYVTK